MRTDSAGSTDGGMLRMAALSVLAIAVIHAAANLSRPLWFDEIFTAIASRPDPGIDWARVSVDVHPPGHVLLVWLWQALVGTGAESLRLTNLLAVPVLMLATRRAARVLDAPRLWLAVALVAGNALFLYFSTELRAYFLLLALSCLGHAGLLGYLHDGRRTDLTLLCLAALAGSALHFFGTAIGGGLVVAAFLAARNPAERLLAALTGLVLLAGFCLWVFGVADLSGNLGGRLWIRNDPMVAAEFLTRLPLVIITGLVALVLARRGDGFRGDGDGLHRPALWLLLPSALALAVAVAVSLHTPVITGKNLIVTLPALALALAAGVPDGLVRLADRHGWAAPALAVTLALAGSYDAGRVTQNARWVAARAFTDDCRGRPIYLAQPDFMTDYLQRLYAPGNARPQLPLSDLSAGSRELLAADYATCGIAGLGWHEDGSLDPLARTLAAAGLPLQPEPAPVSGRGEPDRFAGYLLHYRPATGGRGLQYAENP
jgi:uncharacterized membrane protein